MEMHILPGDSLVEAFKETKIGGEIVVCRECLVDGDVSARSLDDFWEIRANFLNKDDSEDEKNYHTYAKPEFEKILNVSGSATVNLWFEYELFCQVNMWFCLYLLRDAKAAIYRVEPVVRNSENRWLGFGGLNEVDLQKCFNARKIFTPGDLELGAKLWQAFQNGDFEELLGLSKSKSEVFPYLEEVCFAASEQGIRPKSVLQEIIDKGETDFGKIFRKFNETEGVYGFGDLQVKRIYDELRNANFSSAENSLQSS